MKRLLAIVLLCLPLTACFEDPVTEHVHLRVFGSGQAIVTIVHRMASSERAGSNPELAHRLSETRDTVGRGLDPWSRRLSTLAPLAETTRLEHLEGELRRSVHSVALASFHDAALLLETDGLTGSLSSADTVAELQLVSTGGSRATAAQHQEVKRRLRLWSAELAEYFAAAVDLYAYLESRPDRAMVCLAHVFEVHDDPRTQGPLQPTEEDVVTAVKESIERVAEALQVADDRAYSLNELSRLVYDPFPARLTVSVDGDVRSNHGFELIGTAYERPRVDAWSALRSLEGRWLVPDLVTAAVSPAPDDQQPEPDPIRFATLPRAFGSPPTSAEVESALLAEMRPVDELVLRWQRPPSPADGETDRDWLTAIAAAEADLPD